MALFAIENSVKFAGKIDKEWRGKAGIFGRGKRNYELQIMNYKLGAALAMPRMIADGGQTATDDTMAAPTVAEYLPTKNARERKKPERMCRLGGVNLQNRNCC